MMRLLLVAVCALLAVTSAQNLVEKAEELGLTTLVQYAVIAGLGDVLTGDLALTLFAPSNDAFDQLDDDIRFILENDPAALRDVLLTHVVAGNVTSDQLENELLVDTVYGGQSRIRINIYDNGAVLATGSPISATDAEASNGIIHTLDRVIFPPAIDTVYKTLEALDDFVVLAAFLSETGLRELVDGSIPVTIFAPNNEAFANLDGAIIDAILEDPTVLIEILAYHVVLGTQYSAGLTTGQVPSFSGDFLDVVVGASGSVTVNGSPVYEPNFPATNGVIHAVNDVLLPVRFR